MKLDFGQGPTLGVMAMFSQVFVFSSEGEGTPPPTPGGDGAILPHSRARRLAALMAYEM